MPLNHILEVVYTTLCCHLHVQVEELKFDFPFYGHVVNSVAITTAGEWQMSFICVLVSGGHSKIWALPFGYELLHRHVTS